jgi:hypothetical protein
MLTMLTGGRGPETPVFDFDVISDSIDGLDERASAADV